jgi:hypothetical protein
MRAARDAGKPACSVTCLQQRFSSEAVPLFEDFLAERSLPQVFSRFDEVKAACCSW